MRGVCRAAIEELAADGLLLAEHSADEEIDLLWTLLSMPSRAGS